MKNFLSTHMFPQIFVVELKQTTVLTYLNITIPVIIVIINMFYIFVVKTLNSQVD